MHDTRRDSTRRAYSLTPLRKTGGEENKKKKKERPRLVPKLPNRGTNESLKNIVLYVTERKEEKGKKGKKKEIGQRNSFAKDVRSKRRRRSSSSRRIVFSA